MVKRQTAVAVTQKNLLNIALELSDLKVRPVLPKYFTQSVHIYLFTALKKLENLKVGYLRKGTNFQSSFLQGWSTPMPGNPSTGQCTINKATQELDNVRSNQKGRCIVILNEF